MSDRKFIDEFDLLLIANQIIQEHDDYIDGMRATSVEEKDGFWYLKVSTSLMTKAYQPQILRQYSICSNT